MAPAAPGRTRDRAALALAALVAAMLLLRLATLGGYPLMDTSEARYGEIARVMLQSGNFVTPQEIPGTPFWAKPPLYAWLSVGSMQLLGVNEFALRLPSYGCALAVLALCAIWSRSLASGALAAQRTHTTLLTLAMLSTSVLFFVSAGAVMTDPSLALCTTWMLVAFHRAVIGGSRAPIWRWGFFVAAGLGMLAKGPVIGLYVGAPIVLWMIWQRRLGPVWGALPWLGGTLLAALICVPWYVLAEERTPGFLRYFLLGEHFMRFLKPGWGGDLYGTAHAQPLGTIWAYLAGALGLGSALVVAAGLGAARGALRARAGIDPQYRFLLLAALVPLLFFSFARNIIWTYVLPALSPLTVLAADFLAPRLQRMRAWRLAAYGTLAVGGALLALAVIVWVPRHVARHSSAALVAQWRERARLAPGELVYVGRKAPASLRFYSAGSVRVLPDLSAALAPGAGAGDRYVALAPDRTDEVRQYAAAQPGAWSVEEIGANIDLALLHVHMSAAAAP